MLLEGIMHTLSIPYFWNICNQIKPLTYIIVISTTKTSNVWLRRNARCDQKYKIHFRTKFVQMSSINRFKNIIAIHLTLLKCLFVIFRFFLCLLFSLFVLYPFLIFIDIYLLYFICSENTKCVAQNCVNNYL